MPTSSFKIGFAISALGKLLLSIFSISIQSMPECPLLGWQPFCSRLVGGAPVGYFPFEGVYSLPELSVSVFLFALNTLFWILPFFFTFCVITFALRKQLLQSNRAIWVFELLLLAPLFLWLVAYTIEAVGIILPFDLAFHILLFPNYVGKFLLPYDPVDEALDLSARFAMAPGTILHDNQFVIQDVVSGTIQIKADGKPKFLHVWISEAGGAGPRRLFDYVVPIE